MNGKIAVILAVAATAAILFSVAPTTSSTRHNLISQDKAEAYELFEEWAYDHARVYGKEGVIFLNYFRKNHTDSESSLKTISLLRNTKLSMPSEKKHLMLSLMISLILTTLNSKLCIQVLRSLKNKHQPMHALVKLQSWIIPLNLLIGLIRQLVQSEIKDNAIHAGLSLLVVLLKDLMPSQKVKSKPSLLSNLLIVLVDNIKMKDATVETCQMPSGM